MRGVPDLTQKTEVWSGDDGAPASRRTTPSHATTGERLATDVAGHDDELVPTVLRPARFVVPLAYRLLFAVARDVDPTRIDAVIDCAVGGPSGVTGRFTETIPEAYTGLAAQSIVAAGKQLELTRREFRLLELLVLNPGQVVPRERLMDQLFGYENAVNPNALELYVSRIRRRLKPSTLRI